MKSTVIYLAVIILLSSMMSANNNSVEVKAEGKGNSKSSALEQAMRKAKFDGTKELYLDYEETSGRRTLNPSVYIKRYEVLNEEFDKNKNKWNVRIKAIVTMGEIGNDDPSFGEDIDKANQPAILVIPTRRFCHPTVDGIQTVALNTINNYLMEKGFRVVYKNDIIDMIRRNGTDPSPDWCKNAAIEVNATYYINADLIFIDAPKNKDGMYFINSSISLDAYDVENSLGVAASNHQSGQIGSRYSVFDAAVPAVKEAARTSVEDLTIKLAKFVSKPKVYEIKIKGIRDYVLAREFKNALKNHPNFVGDIKMNNQDNLYIFIVTYSNSRADEIIDDIFDAVIDRPGFRTLNPIGIVGKNINFELR